MNILKKENLSDEIRNILNLNEEEFAKHFSTDNLLRCLLQADGKDAFLTEISGVNSQRLEQIELSLAELLAPSAKENIQSAESLSSIVKQAKLVWIRALQTMYLIADQSDEGLRLKAINTYDFGEADAIAGPRRIATYGAGELGANMENFSLFCLSDDNTGRAKSSFADLRQLILKDELIARYSVTDYFLMGKFSYEKAHIGIKRSSASNFIRISFPQPDQLQKFLAAIGEKDITAANLLEVVVSNSITGISSLQNLQRNQLSTDVSKLLNTVHLVGIDKQLPTAAPFSKEQVSSMESFLRPED